MRKDPALGGKYYMKHTAARYITHGSMANSCAEKVFTDMPSPALCSQTVHRGYRHSGFDFTSQYEQIPASTVTSLLHTIGFDGKEYSPPLGSPRCPPLPSCRPMCVQLLDDVNRRFLDHTEYMQTNHRKRQPPLWDRPRLQTTYCQSYL